MAWRAGGPWIVAGLVLFVFRHRIARAWAADYRNAKTERGARLIGGVALFLVAAGTILVTR